MGVMLNRLRIKSKTNSIIKWSPDVRAEPIFDNGSSKKDVKMDNNPVPFFLDLVSVALKLPGFWFWNA